MNFHPPMSLFLRCLGNSVQDSCLETQIIGCFHCVGYALKLSFAGRKKDVT